MSRYKAYPEYRDSGVEWLGEVPAHWNIQKVAWRFFAKKGANAAQLTKEFCASIAGEHPVFSGQTENSGVMACIDSYEFDAGEEGYLFSTTVGAKAMTVMHIAGKFSLSQNCMVIIPYTESSIARFYYYHFQPLFSHERGLIPEHMQASFRMEDLYQYKVIEPQKSEQQKIAEFLDHETAKIDALIEKQQRLIELLKEKRQAVISHAVTKGLNPNAPMKDSGVEWLGEVPAHWAVSQIRRLVQVRGGFAFNSDLFSEEGIPVIRIGDINNDGRISLDACKRIYAVDRGYLQYAVRRGDLLMAMTGATIGKAGWYLSDELAYLNQRVGIFKPLNESLLMTYLWYILNSAGYQAYIKLTAFGGAQPNISDTGMVAYYSATPSLSEQGKIVAYLDVVTKKLDDLCRKAESQISLMQERRTALISAAVTGKIDVRDWQPAAVQEGVGVEC